MAIIKRAVFIKRTAKSLVSKISDLESDVVFCILHKDSKKLRNFVARYQNLHILHDDIWWYRIALRRTLSVPFDSIRKLIEYSKNKDL